MNKKYLVGGGIILGVAIVLSAFFYCRSSFAGSKDNIADKNSKNNEKTRDNVWEKDEFLVDDAQESKVNKTATKVDTDPTSKSCLVNKEYYVSSSYKPSDLVIPNVKFSFNYSDEKRYLREEAAEALEKLFAAAEYYGYRMYATSGYRSYERQTTLYEYNLLEKGYEYTNVYSARPGRSEHQLGFSMDITSDSVGKKLTADFGNTADGKWICDNCHKYGFVIRYPKGKEDITGYAYEPWHIRYVGYDLAKYIYNNHMTLDEYYGYKPNNNNIDQEQMAYYDNLLTKGSNNKQNITQHASNAELDDVNVDVKSPVSSQSNSGRTQSTVAPNRKPSSNIGRKPSKTDKPVRTTAPPRPFITAPPTTHKSKQPATIAPAKKPVDVEKPDKDEPVDEEPDVPTDPEKPGTEE